MQNTTPLEPFVYKGIEVLVKREDQNVTGSHKDRGIWPLLEYYSRKHENTKTQKRSKFVISSSGNAAVSAAYYCREYGLSLDIFVKDDIPERKLEKLQGMVGNGRGQTLRMHRTKSPRREAFQFTKQHGATMISTSTDDHCLAGYSQIVKELPKDIDAIFIPASSGALAVGIFQGYKKLPNYQITKLPFFIVQTPRVHPLIALDIDESEITSKSSMAEAISDVIGARKDQIHEIIQKTRGAGIIAEDRFLNTAMKLLVKHLQITNPSPNGALAFAGFLKVLAKGEFPYKKVVCLYTGE